MTGITAPWRHHPAMDHPRPAEGRCGLMTGLAGCSSWKVVCRLGHHPSVCATMTCRTAGHDPCMVHRCPRPKGGRGLVTSLAPQRRWYVSRRLAQR